MAVPNRTPSGKPKLPDILDILQLSLKAVGIAGVFAVIGYIALGAHQHFLGIQVEVNSFTQLSFAAAAFWFESILTMLQQAQIHWIAALGIVLLVALLSWPHLSSTWTSARLHLVSELGIAAVLIAVSAWTLTMYQLPTIKLHDVMIIGLCAQPGVASDNVLNTRTNRLWSLMIDSRGKDLGCPTKSAVQHQHEEQAMAELSLKDGYALTFLAAVAGWVLIYLRTDRSTAQWVAPVRMIAILGLIVNSLMIPYTYGKLIATMTMPSVEIRLRDQVEPSAKAAAEAKTTDSRVAAEWLGGESLLVTETANSVIVLNFQNRVSRVLDIPRTEIMRLEETDMKDALSARIDNQTQTKVIAINAKDGKP